MPLVKLNSNGLKKFADFLESEAPSLKGRLSIKEGRLFLDDMQMDVQVPVNEDATVNMPRMPEQNDSITGQKPIKNTPTTKPDPETAKLIEKLKPFFPTKQEFEMAIQKQRQNGGQNVNQAYKNLAKALKV